MYGVWVVKSNSEMEPDMPVDVLTCADVDIQAKHIKYVVAWFGGQNQAHQVEDLCKGFLFPYFCQYNSARKYPRPTWKKMT